MFPDQGNIRAGEPQHLGAQRSQFTVAQNQHCIAGIDLDLFQNLESGGQRFRKNGCFIANALRHKVQVRHRYGDPLGESSVGPEDSHDVARRTVAAKPTIAIVALTATEVDFTDHAPADKIPWSIADTADKLMAWDALKSHVAF